MKWAPLRYAANSGNSYYEKSDENKLLAFLCLMASEYSSRPDSIADFAVDQVNYILGENKFGGSFVVGYGKKYPTRAHHRASSCPGPGKPCGDNYLNRNDANPNLLLVSF
jgi:endoglucanase